MSLDLKISMSRPGGPAERPPVLRLAAYVLFGTRVPFRHRFWVRDDVLRSRFYRTRGAAARLVMVFLAVEVCSLGLSVLFALTRIRVRALRRAVIVAEDGRRAATRGLLHRVS
ncbi:hypothetical protein [Actinocorallia herbida]|uniref:hypothetical protein n=1 Tax=Actinocorallia herbida TaxID=58109 RepID=UPI000F4BE054|nr:hypothetical protein [Actinocorallia herbida]